IADAERVGETERLSQLPHFERGGGMHDLWTRIGRRAAVEKALRATSERIGCAPVSKGEFGTGVHPIVRLGYGPAGLAEAHVERHQAATDMRKGAVKHDAAAFITVESEVDEGTDGGA